MKFRTIRAIISAICDIIIGDRSFTSTAVFGRLSWNLWIVWGIWGNHCFPDLACTVRSNCDVTRLNYSWNLWLWIYITNKIIYIYTYIYVPIRYPLLLFVANVIYYSLGTFFMGRINLVLFYCIAYLYNTNMNAFRVAQDQCTNTYNCIPYQSMRVICIYGLPNICIQYFVYQTHQKLRFTHSNHHFFRWGHNSKK